MTTINIAEAKSSFSELVSRTAAGERFVISRRGRAVATLVNSAELERLERGANMAYRLALALGQNATLLEAVERHEVHPAMSAFGLWASAEFENLTDEIYADRESSSNYELKA
ncbi:MAG: type II toxin-antitoxin system prevent-host-death family antitoxin [Anaerolineales bacterium]|nr:type II toxin-antitoxin system prevent-host-death family antitoxin [Anaerolineales bacterium]MDP2776998.1 type II toxin-antitoxin system prevent-host-death family antitoxin [Anaerolineales bacterium]